MKTRGDSKFKETTLYFDAERTIREMARKLASVEVRHSGRLKPNLKERLVLYELLADRWFVNQIITDAKTGEKVYIDGTVCDTLEEVVRFFGIGKASIELFTAANIDYEPHRGCATRDDFFSSDT